MSSLAINNIPCHESTIPAGLKAHFKRCSYLLSLSFTSQRHFSGTIGRRDGKRQYNSAFVVALFRGNHGIKTTTNIKLTKDVYSVQNFCRPKICPVFIFIFTLIFSQILSINFKFQLYVFFFYPLTI